MASTSEIDAIIARVLAEEPLAKPGEPGGPEGPPAPEPPFDARSAGRLGLETAGSITGGLIGSRIGPSTMVAGTGVGAAAGSLASEVFDPSEHPVQRALDTGAEALTGEVIGRGLFGATRAAGRFLGISERAKRAQKVVRELFGAGVGLEETGRVVKNALEAEHKKWWADADALYDEVTRLTGNAPVSMVHLKRNAVHRMREIEQTVGKDSAAMSLLREVLEKPDAVDFDTAKMIRSRLLRISRVQQGDLVHGEAADVGADLADVIDVSMEATARGSGVDALDAWRKANKFWAAGREEFGEKVIKSIAESDPELMVRKALVRDRPSLARRVRTIVEAHDPDVWHGVQREFISQAIERATKEGETSSISLLRSLKAYGPETLREVFPGKQYGRLMDLLQKAAKAERRAQLLSKPLTTGAAMGGVGAIGGASWILGLPPEFIAAVGGGGAVLAASARNPTISRLAQEAVDATGSERAKILAFLARQISVAGLRPQLDEVTIRGE